MRKMRLATSPTSQSIPSTRPSPVIALQETILQCRVENCADFSPSASAISAEESAPGRSCLLAKMSSVAPASFCRQQGGGQLNSGEPVRQ
jgi:hypothetical protein